MGETSSKYKSKILVINYNHKENMLFFYLLGESLSQIITEGRKCPDVPVIPDFTLGKYAGEWHQQIRYPVRYSDPNGKCGQAFYTGIDDVTIKVNNTSLHPIEESPGKWYSSSTIGRGYQVYPDSHPNRIYVKLPKDDDEPIELGRPNYDVMETDYENYSVVWTCSQLGYGTQESVYLEARDRNFRDNNPEWYRELLDRMVTKWGLQLEYTIEQNQDNCEEYEYISENWRPES